LSSLAADNATRRAAFVSGYKEHKKASAVSEGFFIMHEL
jgi:hypothetical protein